MAGEVREQMAAPAEDTEDTGRTQPVDGTPDEKPDPQRGSMLGRLLRAVGPGVITGASDDDPSGIGTYAVAGAQFGFATRWLALASYPLMAAVQFICSRIGLVTGRGLAGVLKEH